MGAGPVEVGIVAQELGRVLAPEPFLTSVVLAGGVVAAAGTDEQKAERPGRARLRGERARVRPRRAGHAAGRRRRPRVTAAGSGRRLDAVRRQGAGAARRPRRPARGQRRPARRRHRAVPGRRRRRRPDPDRLRDLRRRPRRPGGVRRHPGRAARRRRRRDRGDRRAPSTAPGSPPPTRRSGRWSSRCDATSEYLKSRKQFGVPLKTFQALTFRAADMYVSLGARHQRRGLGDDGAGRGHARGGRRGRGPRGPPGQPRVAAHRPGGDPAARRHRDDRGVQRRQLHQPPHRARPPARRRQFHLSALAAAVGDHDEVDPLP